MKSMKLHASDCGKNRGRIISDGLNFNKTDHCYIFLLRVTYNSMRISFLILGSLFLVASCKKDKERLSQVTFSGSIIDSSTKTGIPNVTIKMNWYHSTTSKETPVDSTVTDALGNYSFNSNIDVYLFNTEILDVNAVIPDAYVDHQDLTHSTVGISILGIQSNHLKLLPLYLSPKAFLTITLNRTMSDSFNEFYLFYDYGDRSYWLVSGNLPFAQTYNVVTVAGVQTKLHWTKKLFSGSTINAHDSITCLSNVVNQITMNY
jgi:hypothetical protein